MIDIVLDFLPTFAFWNDGAPVAVTESGVNLFSLYLFYGHFEKNGILVDLFKTF